MARARYPGALDAPADEWAAAAGLVLSASLVLLGCWAFSLLCLVVPIKFSDAWQRRCAAAQAS